MKNYWKYFLFLFPLGVILLHPNAIPIPVGSSFTDLLISHYPNLVFLKRSLFEQGVIPLWNPLILSGAPFLANPLSGFWYLPGWVAMLWNSPAGIFFVQLLHLAWGAVGMYFFLRSEGCGETASFLGAVQFGWMPKLVAHLAAGHVSLIYAISWTPWLLLAQNKQLSDFRKWGHLLPGFVWGVIILADVRWAVYAALLWIPFSLWKIVMVEKTPAPINFKAGIKTIRRLFMQVLFALGICAPFLLPFAQLVQYSTRSSLGVQDAMNLSLPQRYLLSFLFPDFAGYAEWITYFGGMAAFSFLAVIIIPTLRRKNLFWLGWFALSFVLSLGSAIPGLKYLFSLPGFGLLRVPTRFMFLAGFALSVMVAGVYDYLLEKKESGANSREVLIGFVLVVFEVILTLGIILLTGALPGEFLWGSGVSGLLLLIIVAWQKKWFPHSFLGAVLILITLIDLGGVALKQMDFVNWDGRVSRYDSIIKSTQSDKSEFRTYSPSYSLPQDIAALAGIELADGVDPLQLSSYARYMEVASGVVTTGYSVTIPAFHNGDTSNDNRLAKPNAEWLGKLNVKYVLAAFDMDSPDLEWLETIGETRLYENHKVYPRVWMEKEDDSSTLIVENDFIVHRQVNSMEVNVDGAGVLVLSELNYPEWRVYLDGKKVNPDCSYAMLRCVSVPPGRHTVVWHYVPTRLFFGIGIAILTLIIAYIMLFKVNGVHKAVM